MNSSSSRSNTLEQGFIGVLNRMSLVRSLNAAASARAAGSRSAARGAPAWDAAGAPHDRQIRIVERLDQHDLVAGLDQAEQTVAQRLGRARGHQHLALPVDLEPWKRLACSATAWRSSGRPIIGGYWLWPSIR
jgi:hypothetical protein